MTTTVQERPTLPRNLTSQWQFVTPAIAQAYLENNLDNRSIRAVHAGRITHDMSNHNFVVTHQGIAFDEDGRLCDGQHRLLGISNSGQGLWMLVTTGLPRAAQRYMDRGATRRTADFVKGPHATARTSAIRYLLAARAAEGRLTIQRLDNHKKIATDADIHRVLATEPGLAADLDDLAPLAHRAATHVPAGPAGLLAAAVTFPGLAEHALDSMSSGVGLQPGDPVLAFRNYSGRHLGQMASVFASFKVLRAVDEGRRISTFRVLPSEELVFEPR